jgi:hypothetical protein
LPEPFAAPGAVLKYCIFISIMTQEEAVKYRVKYEFLIGHSFTLDDTDVIVKDLVIRENEPAFFEVIVEYTRCCGSYDSTPLSDFVSTIGVAFWIKYFSTLRARV